MRDGSGPDSFLSFLRRAARPRGEGALARHLLPAVLVDQETERVGGRSLERREEFAGVPLELAQMAEERGVEDELLPIRLPQAGTAADAADDIAGPRTGHLRVEAGHHLAA